MPRILPAAFTLPFVLVACGGSSPAGPGGDGNGNGDGTARVVLSIHGQAGTEVDMTVRYVIADGPTTRAAAAAMVPVGSPGTELEFAL